MRFLLFCLCLFGLALPAVAQAPEHQAARAFVKEAFLEQMEGQALSSTTRDLLLSKDGEGHPLSFIPDCPICLGVQDALLEIQVGEIDMGIAGEWSEKKVSTRTSSLARFVRSAVQAKLATIADTEERLSMAHQLQAGSEEGQRQLARYQSRQVETYKMMWSCLMCDAASKAGEDSE